jgi:hypothetical protein
MDFEIGVIATGTSHSGQRFAYSWGLSYNYCLGQSSLKFTVPLNALTTVQRTEASSV